MNLWKTAIRLALEGIVAAGREKAFVGWLENVWRDPTWERNRYYHLKESLLASLLLELRLVQVHRCARSTLLINTSQSRAVTWDPLTDATS